MGRLAPMTLGATRSGGCDLPVVDSVSPPEGNDVGGTAVEITGSFFTGATSVTFKGQELDSFTVDDDSTISGTTASGSLGVGDVVVTTPCGEGTLVNGWEYTFTPM